MTRWKSNLSCLLTVDVAVSARRHRQLTGCHSEVAVSVSVESVRQWTGDCPGAETPVVLSLLVSDSTHIHNKNGQEMSTNTPNKTVHITLIIIIVTIIIITSTSVFGE